MRTKARHHWIVVAVIVLVGIYFAQYARRTRSVRSSEKIQKLPYFTFQDQKGRLIKSKSFYSGKNLYIQFLNKHMPDELELFKITYEKWKDHDIWFLLIGRLDQEEGLGVISSDRLTIFNLERNIDRLNVYSVFGLRSQDSYFYVFDSAGRKVVASRSVLGYERGPKTFLNELLTGTRFSIEELMERNHNIGEYEWFRSIDKIITSNREYEYFVFSLLTKICDSCAGAEIVQFMKRIRLITPQGVYVASFLGREFSESDITNLKSQLNINYPIFIADNELRWKWDELIDKYN